MDDDTVSQVSRKPSERLFPESSEYHRQRKPRKRIRISSVFIIAISFSIAVIGFFQCIVGKRFCRNGYSNCVRVRTFYEGVWTSVFPSVTGVLGLFVVKKDAKLLTMKFHIGFGASGVLLMVILAIMAAIQIPQNEVYYEYKWVLCGACALACVNGVFLAVAVYSCVTLHKIAAEVQERAANEPEDFSYVRPGKREQPHYQTSRPTSVVEPAAAHVGTKETQFGVNNQAAVGLGDEEKN